MQSKHPDIAEQKWWGLEAFSWLLHTIRYIWRSWTFLVRQNICTDSTSVYSTGSNQISHAYAAYVLTANLIASEQYTRPPILRSGRFFRRWGGIWFIHGEGRSPMWIEQRYLYSTGLWILRARNSWSRKNQNKLHWDYSVKHVQRMFGWHIDRHSYKMTSVS